MAPERTLADPTAKRALDELHDKPLNFDLSERERFTREAGWHVDDYRQPLPAVPGSWEAARRLMTDYAFADPSIVRAIYRPESPLDGREMLLEIRFLGLRFKAGVRVGGVRDETCTVDGQEVRIWGWNYRTLSGHLEMGQMDYELWKWLDTGEVEFRIHAFSRPASIRNPLVRLGFRIFGRREQLRFARNACRRMARLVEASLRDERVAAPDIPVAPR
jgi:uncharacterized protein (UPF0548 family)